MGPVYSDHLDTAKQAQSPAVYAGNVKHTIPEPDVTEASHHAVTEICDTTALAIYTQADANGDVEYMIPIQTPDVPTKETNLEWDDDLIENDETNKLSIDFENTLHISDKVIRRDEQNGNRNIKKM